MENVNKPIGYWFEEMRYYAATPESIIIRGGKPYWVNGFAPKKDSGPFDLNTLIGKLESDILRGLSLKASYRSKENYLRERKYKLLDFSIADIENDLNSKLDQFSRDLIYSRDDILKEINFLRLIRRINDLFDRLFIEIESEEISLRNQHYNAGHAHRLNNEKEDLNDPFENNKDKLSGDSLDLTILDNWFTEEGKSIIPFFAKSCNNMPPKEMAPMLVALRKLKLLIDLNGNHVKLHRVLIKNEMLKGERQSLTDALRKYFLAADKGGLARGMYQEYYGAVLRCEIRINSFLSTCKSDN